MGTRGDQFARAKANELPVSPKHAIEIARFIRNQDVNRAISYLNDVVEKKKAVPFRRFNRNVAHKRGLEGWAPADTPVKAAGYISSESLNRNAEYRLSTPTGRDRHAAEPCRVRRPSSRAMGRATPKRARR